MSRAPLPAAPPGPSPPAASAVLTAHRSLRNNDYVNNFTLTLFLAMQVIACIVNCWWHHCAPTRQRRQKEVEARRRMKEYKERRIQEAGQSNGADEHIVYREYECSYNGSTRGSGVGYGHGELHLVISPSMGDGGRCTISGCGMRELEYTEIVEGHVDPSGNAEWTEQIQREIYYHPPPGYRNSSHSFSTYLRRHVGPASIRSKGRFDSEMKAFEGEYYGRDDCRCENCFLHWARVSIIASPWQSQLTDGNDGSATNYPQTLHGEPVRWCPAAERRKVGEYILFRRKEACESSNGEGLDSEDAYHRMV